MKNFFDCKDEKITEKAFSQGLILSAVSILLCLVALCSMSYAWFSTETKSSGNTLTSGSFDLNMTVFAVENETVTANKIELTPDPARAGRYVCTLEEGTYEISLALTPESNGKGHCVVKLGDKGEEHTAAIIGEQTANVDENEPRNDPFTFRVTVTEQESLVLEPRWGIVVEPRIKENAKITVGESQLEIQYDDVVTG